MAGAAAVGSAAARPLIDPDRAVVAAQAQPGRGPYGPIAGRVPDENGLILPPGFTSRVIGIAGEEVGETGFDWHLYPDGGATFEDPDGDGWIYVCNSEIPQPINNGGVSAVRFDADGEIIDAYRILDGTTGNCAGGPTPWGTWLSCEEFNRGQVWECDPTGKTEAQVHPALGTFAHEAVAVDPEAEQLFLTEDAPQGRLYRFTPDDYPSLESGLLEAAAVRSDNSVEWIEVPDPEWLDRDGPPTGEQVEDEATLFAGGEGIWHHDGSIFFTTKTDNRVHRIDVAENRYELIYEVGDLGSEAELRGVDNITVDPATGDLYVAEDDDDLQIVLISSAGVVAPFCQVPGDLGLFKASEITGPCFSPDGTRLYFSSQRGGPNLASQVFPGVRYSTEQARAGITYEVTGPFRGSGPVARGAAAVDEDAGTSNSDDSGSDLLVPVAAFLGGGAVTVLGVGAGLMAVRGRGRQQPRDVPGAGSNPQDLQGRPPL